MGSGERGEAMTEPEFHIFEAIGALVVVLAPDGRIVYWNHPCSDLTGYPLEEVRGRKIWDFLLLPEEVERVRAAFATLLTSEHASPFANHWVAKTGERRWIAWSHTLATRPDGGVQYVIKTGIDRTESKRASDAGVASRAMLGARAAETARQVEDARRLTGDLREANEHMVRATLRAQELTEDVEAALARSEQSERELRAVAEFREMFISIVGHDLRNPLGTIVMNGEMIAHCRVDDQARLGASRIVASAQRMSRMIVQLLDFARVRLGGGFPLEARPTNLGEVCRSVVQEFGPNVHLDVEGDVAGTWDPDRLAEALSNIAGNAVEHARPGTEVVVRAHPEGAEVVVEITNRGEPIPPELLPFIFEPFRRGKHEKSSTGNLGLGLYIAKQIVLTSGGTLDARSADGSTTFALRLPRQTPAANRSQPQAGAPA
jgi:PAS domain S-box-containing protein